MPNTRRSAVCEFRVCVCVAAVLCDRATCFALYISCARRVCHKPHDTHTPCIKHRAKRHDPSRVQNNTFNYRHTLCVSLGWLDGRPTDRRLLSDRLRRRVCHETIRRKLTTVAPPMGHNKPPDLYANNFPSTKSGAALARSFSRINQTLTYSLCVGANFLTRVPNFLAGSTVTCVVCALRQIITHGDRDRVKRANANRE